MGEDRTLAFGGSAPAPTRRLALALTCLAVGGLVGSAADARAQGPAAALLHVEAPAGAESLARAVESTLRAELDRLGVVEVTETPAMGLEGMQLALGCVGETSECLGEVTNELDVEALVLPSVEPLGDTVVLEVAFFDAHDKRIRRATRRASGGDASGLILDEVPSLLRELFGLPEEPTEPETADAPPDTAEQEQPDGTAGLPSAGVDRGSEASAEGELPAEARGDEASPAEPAAPAEPVTAEPPPSTGEGGLPVVPFVLAGAGVAVLGAGVALGVLAKNSEDDFTGASVGSRAEVDAARDDLDKAESRALTANVLFGLGGALVVTGTVLVFVMKDDGAPADERVAVTPAVGPRGAGVVVRGALGGGR